MHKIVLGTNHLSFMRVAIDLSKKSVRENRGGPFGAVIVQDGRIIAEGYNQVTLTCDPTAHAEVVAIRQACKVLNTFQLRGCDLFTSCEPCPMCLAAIYWARIARVYFANTKEDAAKIGFDDKFIYDELELPIALRKLPMVQCLRDEALVAFKDWQIASNKTLY